LSVVGSATEKDPLLFNVATTASAITTASSLSRITVVGVNDILPFAPLPLVFR
jgi:hypothetical protein